MTSQKNSSSTEVPDKPTLHEILLAEKMDFDAKLQRLQVTYKFYRIFLINIYCISPIFFVKLLMSMEMTWLDFQFSTDNQNGRGN